MKTIARNLMNAQDEKAEGPAVENSIFIFLTFVNSIIPTINCDSTIMDVTAHTKKQIHWGIFFDRASSEIFDRRTKVHRH
jgi:hypothetical protein